MINQFRSLSIGNCRWNLLGHSAAVDTLNLDAEGCHLLSWDSQDNDRSLRLWNLTNGMIIIIKILAIHNLLN